MFLAFKGNVGFHLNPKDQMKFAQFNSFDNSSILTGHILGWCLSETNIIMGFEHEMDILKNCVKYIRSNIPDIPDIHRIHQINLYPEGNKNNPVSYAFAFMREYTNHFKPEPSAVQIYNWCINAIHLNNILVYDNLPCELEIHLYIKTNSAWVPGFSISPTTDINHKEYWVYQLSNKSHSLRWNCPVHQI